MSPEIPGDDPAEISRRLAVLGQLSALLARDYRAAEVFPAVLLLTCEALGVRHGALFSCSPNSRVRDLYAVIGWEAGFARDILQTCQIPDSVFPSADNLAVSHRFPPRESLARLDMRDAITAFIAQADGNSLCLCLFSPEVGDFSDLDLEYLGLIAHMLATAMKYLDLMQGETHSVRSAIQAKQEWEATVDVLPQLVCLVDRKLNILRANRAVEYWGLGKVDKMPGRPLAEMLAGLQRAEQRGLSGFPERAAAALATARHYTERQEEDEHNQDLFLGLRRLNGDGGDDEQAWAAFVMEDITERCLAETTLRRYNQDLEEKVRQRTEELRLANESLVRQVEAHEMAQIALEKSRADLQILSSQLLYAQETERKRIACELHDGVGQILSAIKFQIEHLMNTCERTPVEENKAGLSGAVARLRDAVEEIRRISMNLRPSILDDLGIVATLTWFVREFNKTYHCIRTELDVTVDERDVREEIKIVIFRIIQEACNNVIKHAEASEIMIMLELCEDGICLRIRDNGHGFDAAVIGAAGHGTGLSSMQERAHLSGGNCRIISNPGQGTEVLIFWGEESSSVELVLDGVGNQRRR